jgi:tripartite-type tricarboxylate transporter receptor subunit TctC
VRPLAVFDEKRLAAAGWGDIPTVKEALGVDISYLMLRGIFGAPDMPAEAVAFYQGMLQKVYDTPEFKEYIQKGALNAAWQTGPEYVKWLESAEALHRDLMKKGGLLK